MNQRHEASDQTLYSYICARCNNAFESLRHLASTCPICGYAGSENLSSEARIDTEK
ncbi:MAG: hypothetical protein ACOX4H_04040 [Bacillota bacterium]|jgi:rRNA maturation endonuclease Nob1